MIIHRIRLVLVFTAISMLMPILTSCSMRNSTGRTETTKDKPEESTVRQEQFYVPGTAPGANAGTAVKPEPEPASDTESGSTTQVPWNGDEEFKAAQEKAGTFILMAAYRTVLRDPLPGEEYNVHLAARLLAGSVINPGKVFSQNQKVGPYTEARGFKRGPTYIGTKLTTTIGGGVCKIASTLYNATVLSNLQIIERHAHSMPVPYVPYGQDATVSYGDFDFRFRNSTESPVLIWAQGVDNILYIAFYGKQKPPIVEWHHKRLETYKAQVIYRKNPSLSPGTERTVHEGMDGGIVKTWLTIEKPDGTVVTKEMGNSNYDPMPHIIEKR
jgi:vancomycin resistance protein YoaR